MSSDTLNRILELQHLYEGGAITEAEHHQRKAQILDRISGDPATSRASQVGVGAAANTGTDLNLAVPNKNTHAPVMVIIPGGSFLMGSNEYQNAKPVHRVTIKSFAMGKYPVTQREWKAIMGDNPSFFKDSGDDAPVENVSWDDVQQYIQKLNARSGQHYRLPSEAEWEYAARAGSQGKWCFGDDENKLEKYAWYDKSGNTGTYRVGQKLSNAFGLHDMHGNVWEWVQDVWHHNYEDAPKDGSAWVADGKKQERVFRGGSWVNLPLVLRSADRDRVAPDNRFDFLGFRLARTAP